LLLPSFILQLPHGRIALALPERLGPTAAPLTRHLVDACASTRTAATTG
jgi:hypothetical protein